MGEAIFEGEKETNRGKTPGGEYLPKPIKKGEDYYDESRKLDRFELEEVFSKLFWKDKARELNQEEIQEKEKGMIGEMEEASQQGVIYYKKGEGQLLTEKNKWELAAYKQLAKKEGYKISDYSFSEEENSFLASIEKKDRSYGYKKFKRFLKHTGFDETISEKEKVEWLKKVDYKKFMELLSVTNGLFQSKDKFQRWKDYKVGKNIVSMGGRKENIALEPPEEPEKEFQKLFEEMQENISEENIKRYAAKIYAGIIFSHMFKDGNGRTARSVYTLMNSGVSLGESSILISELGPFCAKLGLYGMLRCFHNYDIKVKEIKEMQENYYTIDTKAGALDWSSMDSLKYLAVKAVMEKKNKEIGKVFNMESLDSQEREQYEKEYRDIRKEWFWEIQKGIDEYEGPFVGALDKILLTTTGKEK